MILRTTTASPKVCFDHYVRLSRRDLQELQLDLLWMTWPATSDGQSLGYTEWSGDWLGTLVSVACYWRVYADGVVVSSDPCDVSTNLMLVETGYDAGPMATAQALIPLISKWFVRTADLSEHRIPPLPTFVGLLQ